MGISRLSEFFQDETKQLSMSRLLCFLSFWPGAYVVVLTQDADALAWFLASFSGAYVGGKLGDALNNRTRGTVNVDGDH